MLDRIDKTKKQFGIKPPNTAPLRGIYDVHPNLERLELPCPFHPAIGFAKGSVFAASGVRVLVVSGPCVEGGDER
jgi:hypothetical protein